MKIITRREVLRRLGGLSVVAALGGAAQAVVRSVGEPSGPSGVNDFPQTTSAARHGGDAGIHVATKSSQLDAATPTLRTAGSGPATTGEDSLTSTILDAGNSTTLDAGNTTTHHATTTSTPPPVALGTLELAGIVSATVVSPGQVATIVGDVELRGDLVVEGVLTGVDTFRLEGNAFQIEVRNGGQIDLRGTPKSGWVRGGSPAGWQSVDRILTAPVEPDRYGVSDFGAGPPGVLGLADGRNIAAEQFNLTRSIVINNVSRLMFHGGAGRQVLKHVAVTNSGITGKLAFYPIHFHLNGNTTRGSIVEGVVVENGHNHAFVPHGSHGITFLDCVAFNTTDHAYWWDPPPASGDTSNDSDDVVWQHCLAAAVSSSRGEEHRLTAFFLGRGSGNRCVDCTAVAVEGGKNSSGFHWPENGGAVWEFSGCLAHNNVSNGIFVWQNGPSVHLIRDFIAYRCGRAGIEHGAYRNNYQYQAISLTDTGAGVISHALSKEDGLLLFENIISNGELVISLHNNASNQPVVYRYARFPRASLHEVVDGKGEPGVHEFSDTGLQPGTIDVSAIHPATIVRIFEGGQLRWEWTGRAWNQV
jgi:hypothetical protein